MLEDQRGDDRDDAHRAILYNAFTLRIAPPFGCDEVVPLQTTDRVLLPAGGAPSFCRALNALALSYSEFVAAARDYPIVFASGDGGASFSPVIVLGLAEGTNLFVDAPGDWDPQAYLPAYVRRYPFCLSKVYRDGVPSGERLVCVARACLEPGRVAPFDGEGRPTPRWQAIERLLAEYEADLDRPADMCATLARLGVFAPFTMEVRKGARARTRVAGMYRVDEARLAALAAADLKSLAERGTPSRVYAHLHSLANFARLYAREQVAARARGAPAPGARR
ncbi:MAG: SapC family protein [Burkholderiales bacterium]|nr:SapC family protein [Burkholderiales bacterium]